MENIKYLLALIFNPLSIIWVFFYINHKFDVVNKWYFFPYLITSVFLIYLSGCFFCETAKAAKIVIDEDKTTS